VQKRHTDTWNGEGRSDEGNEMKNKKKSQVDTGEKEYTPARRRGREEERTFQCHNAKVKQPQQTLPNLHLANIKKRNRAFVLHPFLVVGHATASARRHVARPIMSTVEELFVF
jgi:hypothetical protein